MGSNVVLQRHSKEEQWASNLFAPEDTPALFSDFGFHFPVPIPGITAITPMELEVWSALATEYSGSPVSNTTIRKQIRDEESPPTPGPKGMSDPRSGPDGLRLLPKRTTNIHPTPRRTMKSLILNIRTMAAFAAVLAIPHLASAATKTWTVLSAAPATTNITAGVAANPTTPPN